MQNGDGRAITRRAFLVRSIAAFAGLSAVPLALSGCIPGAGPAATPVPAKPASAATTAPAAAVTTAPAKAFDWKKYSGQPLSIWLHDAPGFSDWIRNKKLAEFEELTGMKVSYDTASVTDYRTKQPIELAAKSSSFDVMGSMTVVEGRQYANAGWYEVLDKYISDPGLTAPDWDFGDFSDGAKSSMQLDGKTINILYEAQTLLLFYRKDLFEKYGAKVPNTFDELEQTAKALHLKEPGVYGIALRGGGYQMTTPFSSFLYGYGGSWLDKAGNPALNTPEALKAFEMYGRIGHDYGPPGAAAFSYEQVIEGFSQGKLAMTADINVLASTFEDKGKSKVAGKVGYAMVPGGPAGRKPFVAGWGLSVNPYSKRKEQAWYFVQWITNKANQLERQLKGDPNPRNSPWESPQFKGQDKLPELSKANQDSYKIGIPYMNPPVVAGLEARKLVGSVGDLVLQGATPDQIKQAADKANKDLADLIKKTGG